MQSPYSSDTDHLHHTKEEIPSESDYLTEQAPERNSQRNQCKNEPIAARACKAIKKADSFPSWPLPVFSSTEANSSDACHSLLRNRAISVPGAVRSIKRHTTIGHTVSDKILSSLTSLLTTVDEDEDLWFTCVEDFHPPIIAMQRTTICNTYHVKAIQSKRNYVMHEYLKSALSDKDMKRVSRLVDFMQWIRHPHIIKCLGSWETDNAFYIIEAYCHRSHLLGQLVMNKRMFTEEFVVTRILKPVLDALVYLHQMSIAHRSVIPENIHFGRGNVLQLSGFISAIECTQSRPSSRQGLVDYTPPEVLEISEECQSNSAEKIDVWQVGILAYELLSGGGCPFEVHDTCLTSQCILWAEIQSFPADFSSDAIGFIEQCLNKDPNARPSALELTLHPWLMQYSDADPNGDRNQRSCRFWKRLNVLRSLKRFWRRKVMPTTQRRDDSGKTCQTEDEDVHETVVSIEARSGHGQNAYEQIG